MSAKGDPGEARRGRRVRFDRSQGEKAMPVPRPVRTGQRARGVGRRFVTAAVLA